MTPRTRPTSTLRTRSRSALVLSAAAVLCTGLAACSGGGSTTTAAGTAGPPAGAAHPASGHASPAGAVAGATHPCALLTRAEASAADGQSLGAGAEDPVLGTCSYLAPDFSGVTLTVSSWQAITDAAHGNGHTPPAVSGVGDEAYFGAGLSVRKGTDGFLLLVSGPTIDGAADRGLAQQKTLADLILPRL
jgi:hypothetical protein